MLEYLRPGELHHLHRSRQMHQTWLFSKSTARVEWWWLYDGYCFAVILSVLLLPNCLYRLGNHFLGDSLASHLINESIIILSVSIEFYLPLCLMYNKPVEFFTWSGCSILCGFVSLALWQKNVNYSCKLIVAYPAEKMKPKNEAKILTTTMGPSLNTEHSVVTMFFMTIEF